MYSFIFTIGNICFHHQIRRAIKRLKETKMPIKEIQKYAKLRAIGDSTMTERMEMLIKHRIVLEEEITKANENLQKLNEKIDFYKSAIDEKNEFKFECI